jgi:hypothetical protein
MLMGTRVSTTRPLNFRHALRVKMAEYWLKLGEADVAAHELNRLPSSVLEHPEVQRVRAEINARLMPR